MGVWSWYGKFSTSLPMQVKINGEKTTFESTLNLEELLRFYKLKTEMVVIEYNRRVPAKPEYSGIHLQEGDEIEIVKFLGGG